MSSPHFFALIIGTEILNRRREDAHFDFVTKALAAKGYKLSASFIIEDDPALIVQTLKFIASQPNPVLFSFGGIGSTPDDYTRKCAAIALRDGSLPVHEEAKEIIEKKLGEKAYPHSIKMAQLPKGASLLYNPVNDMPAFSLDERYFFMPGFPEMSHPMVEEIINRLVPTKRVYYRHTLTAQTKESTLIKVMEQMPKEVEFSSLPKLKDEADLASWEVSISVASHDEIQARQAFKMFTDYLELYKITYTREDRSN
ncbi:molybdopterin-binding protein [Sulfurovum sp.]|uniref:competence/damage-inducible protein A n=1 Tax=Sulfurovum sp. TaxID=1969726 RepID=UPI0025CFAD32|nr:molybdopterin-binding protein [Sulfurovum sp.]